MDLRGNSESEVSQGQEPSQEILEKARTMLTADECGCKGLGLGWGLTAEGHEGPFQGYENFLCLDSASGDRSVHICQKSSDCAFKMSKLYYM